MNERSVFNKENVKTPRFTIGQLVGSGSALSFVVSLFVLVYASNTYAVSVGPKLKPTIETPKTERKLPDPLNLIPLHAVVTVLDPGFVSTDKDLDKKGIWPELRNTESIRSAVKIKESLIGINQFESVHVVPDTSASADFYLIGMIKDSTGEILRIGYMLVDATGKTWFNKTAVHRVEVGWHERFGEPGKDPFQPVYTEIGNEVWKVLKQLAEDHTKTAKDNQTRAKRNRPTELSNIEVVSAVRQLVLAQYFNPSLYAGSLTISRRANSKERTYGIKYLPDRNSADWQAIQRIAARDQDFIDKINEHYSQFMKEVNPTYEDWVEETFPYAREIRLAKRQETIANVATGVLAVATVAAAVDANDSDSRDKALAIGGTLTSAALIKGMMDRHRKNQNLGQFNELAQSYHDTFKPIRVSVGKKVITLEGTAVSQFNQWREILTDVYNQENADFESIKVVE